MIQRQHRRRRDERAQPTDNAAPVISQREPKGAVLFVEDDHDLLVLIRLVLEERGREAVLASLPVLVQSAADRTPPLGIIGMVKKPVDIATLLALVEQHCR